MSTALTTYAITTASTTLSTADQVISSSGGAAGTGITTKVDTSTGWGEVYSQGNTSAWGAGGSIGSPSGHGWLFDVTTLEAQQILAGNWSATMTMKASSFVTVTPEIRFYVRSSGGTYTAIGTITASSVQLGSSNSTISFANTSLSLTNFSTGDKLYIDLWCNITVAAGFSGTTISYLPSSSTSLGWTGAQVVTPGYQSSSTTTDKKFVTRFFQYVTAQKKFVTRFFQYVTADKTWKTRFFQYDFDKRFKTRFFQYITTQKKFSTRLKQVLLAQGTFSTRFNQYDANNTAQMLYDDLQTQYVRLRTPPSRRFIQLLAIVYYVSAQILSEHAVPGELDVLENGETLSQLHVLKSIKNVTDFIGGIVSNNLSIFNVKDYGAAGDGSTDDTTTIQSTITAANANGGIVYFPPATYKITSPLTLSSPNVGLIGCGASSQIQPAASFSGAQIILITANFCGVRDLRIAYANTSYGSNPSANGIQITGAQNALIQNVVINYINGWAIQSSATSGVRNKWTKFDNVFSTLCAKGIHVVGVSTNVNAAHVMTDCILDQVATGTSNGDGYFIEDSVDIECSNLECNLSAGSGSAFHVKGASASIHLANFVGGGDNNLTTGPGVLIEAGPNGTPTQIEIVNSVIETANDGIDVTSCTQLSLTDCRLEANQFYGINLSGGDCISIHGCSFNTNNQHGGASHYDLVSTTSGNVLITNCSFLTPSGTSAGQTAAGVSVTGGHVFCNNNIFLGTAFGGLPQVIRANNGYNPVGVLGPPAVPASTTPLTNPYSVDCSVFIAGGTVSAIAIGGSSTGLTSGTFRVPATQSIKLTYTVAPTWSWFGD